MMNLKRLGEKDEEEGFTLIELLVVVLILGILMAIAIPTFLSLTGGAKTTAAEADLTTAAQDEAVYLTQNGSFDSASTYLPTVTTDNITAMQQADSGINWAASAGPTAGTKTVGVEVARIKRLCGRGTGLCITRPAKGVRVTATQVLYLETAGSDGNYYWIADVGGKLSYSETTTILDPGRYPRVWQTSWKSLPSQVEDDS